MRILGAILSLCVLFCLPVLAKGSKRSGSTSSKVRVKGYTKKNGRAVTPSSRTAPNKTQTDNYSTKGNRHPDTGKKGTKRAIR